MELFLQNLVASLIEFFKSVIIIWPRRKETYSQHSRHNPHVKIAPPVRIGGKRKNFQFIIEEFLELD